MRQMIYFVFEIVDFQVFVNISYKLTINNSIKGDNLIEEKRIDRFLDFIFVFQKDKGVIDFIILATDSRVS